MASLKLDELEAPVHVLASAVPPQIEEDATTSQFPTSTEGVANLQEVSLQLLLEALHSRCGAHHPPSHPGLQVLAF